MRASAAQPADRLPGVAWRRRSFHRVYKGVVPSLLFTTTSSILFLLPSSTPSYAASSTQSYYDASYRLILKISHFSPSPRCHEPACDHGPTKAAGQPRPTRTRRGSRSRDKAIHVRTLYMLRHVNIHNMYAVITVTIQLMTSLLQQITLSQLTSYQNCSILFLPPLAQFYSIVLFPL